MANTRDTIGESATLDGLVANTLTELEEDGVTQLPAYALCAQTNLVTCSFPNLQRISGSSFGGSITSKSRRSLSNIILNNNVICDAFPSEVITGTTERSSNAYFTIYPFDNGTCKIFVNNNLLNDYKNGNTLFQRYRLTIFPYSTYPNGAHNILTNWNDIISAVNNGTYTNYSLGTLAQITINNQTFLMELIGKDIDNLADGSGNKAHTTWLLTQGYTTRRMNSTNTNVGGWNECELRGWLISDVLSILPSEIKQNIKTVIKRHTDGNKGSAIITSNDDIWIPSASEATYYPNWEANGVVYPLLNTYTCKRYSTSTNQFTDWWTRTSYQYNTTNFNYIRGLYENGGTDTSATAQKDIVFGFCI